MKYRHTMNLAVVVLFSVLAVGSGTTDPNIPPDGAYAQWVRQGRALPYYTLNEGDSLLTVSKKTGVRLDEIYQYNGFPWPWAKLQLYVGQKIWVVDPQTASMYEMAQSANRAQQSVNANNTANDEQICTKYGFKKGTNPFAECMMKIDFARREMAQQQAQFNQQVLQYQQQLDAQDAERKRRQNAYITELGVRMMGGQAPLDAAVSVGTGAPITPPQAPSSMRIYTLPNGRTMTCTSNGDFVNCN